ncbi:S8 family serine peptidase [bacterium]|nr:S8 family serine peptidase [bacterium]
MTRKNWQWIILAAALLALAALPALPEAAAQPQGVVGVRIPVDAAGGERATASAALQGAIKAERVIDYGSFLWAVVSPGDLAGLDAAGIAYQKTDNPYTLTLGGQSFDPLDGVPGFAMAEPEKGRGVSGAGLHLVQFVGPTKDDWLAELARAGLDVVQYIHPFTYVVWGDLGAVDRARGQAAVRWAGDYLPAFAVAPKDRFLNSDPLLVRVMVLPQAGLDGTVRAIEALGAETLSTSSGVDPAFDLATFNIPGDQLGAVGALPGVYSVQPVPLDGGDRGEMSNQINVGNYDGTNEAYPGYEDWLAGVGLSGDGVIIANVDSGIDATNPDITNRILPCTGSTCGDGEPQPWTSNPNHGTHTAGIMAADGTSGTLDSFGFLRGLGMAPGANLIEQVYYPTYQDTDGMLTLMTQSYNNGALVSGNSWGPSGTAQGYDEYSRLVDIGVRDTDPGATGNQELSYVLSFMNGYGGTSSQGSPDEAKNIFTIGATVMQNSGGDQALNVNDLASVTAHGPALDGRTIPHLVAPGCYVDSTYYTSDHGLMCGTSMASPHVSGAVALFIEKYRQMFPSDGDPSPALVKAAFLPVAHDLAGHLDADDNVMGHPFDSKQGWGRLDAAAVLDPSPSTTVLYFDQETLLTNTGDSWDFQYNATYSLASLRAMLVWTDAPGPSLVGGPSNTTPAWVNDLDFEVTFDGDTYLGNDFDGNGISIPNSGNSADGMNNTEGIFLENKGTGTYTFTVNAAQIAGDGVPGNGDSTDQDFALVIYLTELTEISYFPIFYH